MVRAFVMVDTGTGTADSVVTAVRDLDDVVEAHVVAGDHDIIVQVEADTVRRLLQVVSEGIREIDGVTDTRTYVAMD